MASRNSTTSLPPGIRDNDRRVVTNDVYNDRATFLKYGAETDGEYTRVRVLLRPGGGTPHHFHNAFTETFFPANGTLGVDCGERTLHVNPGESATVPLNTKHRFFNDGKEDVEFEVELRPAHQGFEQSIYIFYGLVNDGHCDSKGFPNFVNMCLFGQMGDTQFPGIRGALLNMFTSVVASYARWSGREEELLRRYWY